MSGTSIKHQHQPTTTVIRIAHASETYVLWCEMMRSVML